MSIVTGPRPRARHEPPGHERLGPEPAGDGRSTGREPAGRPETGPGARDGDERRWFAPAWPVWPGPPAWPAPAWAAGLVAEWRALASVPLARLRRGRLPLAFGSAALVLVLWALQFSPWGASLVALIADVSPSTPFHLLLPRLPASMFAAAPNLPVWGSLLQVFVVFGLAEAWLGRARTVTVALGATFVCTLSGRLMCALGPHTVVGLPWFERYADDTGPSAAVVALVVYLCCVRRAPRTLALVLAVMVTEVVVLPNLAGREHVVAIALGLLAGVAVPAAGRWSRGWHATTFASG